MKAAASSSSLFPVNACPLRRLGAWRIITPECNSMLLVLVGDVFEPFCPGRMHERYGVDLECLGAVDE